MDAARTTRIAALALGLALSAVAAWSAPPAGAASRPRSSLDAWRTGDDPPPAATTTPAAARPGTASVPAAGIEPPAGRPVARANQAGHDNLLPGVVVLSDGQVLAGTIRTTTDKNWEVWVEAEKRWRHVPPIVVLSIQAVVLEESLDKEWRWKEMGSDERVFTGRTRPIRRHDWTFHLIDGSTVTGSVKGQPLWVETADGAKHGPYILQERTAGDYGQALADLVYVHQVVVSRTAMETMQRKVIGNP